MSLKTQGNKALFERSLLVEELGAEMTQDLISYLKSERAVADRFTREPRHIEEKVTCEFTDDPALLHQYYQLREIMYKRVHNLARFNGQEDIYDKIGHILVARRGRLVIGGLRIVVREADETFNLPMEEYGLSLRNAFFKDSYCQSRHAETSRFAILSDKFEKEIMYNMLRRMLDKLVELQVSYLFVKSTPVMLRNWRKMSIVLGFPVEAPCNVDVPSSPDYPEIKWQIGRVDLPASAVFQKG